MLAFSTGYRCAVLLTLLILAACSGNAAAPTATNPPPAPTIIPTFQFVPPTQVPRLVTAAAATQASGVSAGAGTLDLQMIERGRRRYEALGCGSCHGENGEGTDEGSPLNDDLGLTLAEFISFMRSGGKLGTAHQYASNRLSESGAANLHQYLLSLNSATGAGS